MGNEDGFAACARFDLRQHGRNSLSCLGLIKSGGVGGHLTEELVLRFLTLRELAALIAFRGYPANAEVSVPGLIAGLVILGFGGPGIQETV